MAVKTIKSVLFSSLVNSFLCQGRRRVSAPLVALLLTAAMAALGAAAPAQADSLAVAQTSSESVSPRADRYLFGQSSQPDQIGQGYVVLERTGDRVHGALYYPSSSFDCFYGQVQGTEVAMTIINSYDQEAYPYSLALAEGPAVATAGSAGESLPFSLDGFYAFETLSDNDHRMLDQCRGALAPVL
jgi:hypothetical protein